MTQAGTTAPTPDSPDELALAAEFATPRREDWQRLVAGVLAKSGALPEDFDGAPESLLTSTTYDGITIQPLYTADSGDPVAGYPGLPPYVRGAVAEGTGWDVRVLHGGADAAQTNKAILADLENGASSVWLRVGGDALRPDALADALNEVYLDLAPIVLDPGADYEAAAEALLGLLAEKNIPDSEVTGVIGADPIALRARTGRPHDTASAAALAARLAPKHPGLRTLVVNALPYHEAGGSDSQELGAAIAAGVAYLRALTDAGLSVDDAAGQLEFRFAATADQFLTIAKLRAARRLWARVCEVSGVNPGRTRGMRQHAVTSPVMLTRRDPWVNMLRTTVACFAAGVGGADAVTVLPFDSAIGLPDAFARRIARNTQAILLEESKLSGVIDPAGGSWYVENLTDALANAAWREFTEIERQGGIEAALDSGALAERLDGTWRQRSRRLATREDPITGVSEFPDLHEKPVERTPTPSVVDEGGLPRRRYAQDYEALRDRSDAHLAETGARPKVFLATLGPIAAHTARATFASNLFQAGGVEPVNPGAVDGVDALVTAFRDSGATIACLCGTDKLYAERAADTARELKAAGAVRVLLAGKPGEYADVDDYVHAGCDALAALTGTLDTLGVK